VPASRRRPAIQTSSPGVYGDGDAGGDRARRFDGSCLVRTPPLVRRARVQRLALTSGADVS
jgi:hypothetical protein